MSTIGNIGNIVTLWRTLSGKRIHGEQDQELGETLSCPVFVINLERSKHRRDFMVSYLSGLGIEARIFPAVDGSKLDVALSEEQGLYSEKLTNQKFSRSLSRNEIACTLSHLGVCRKMVDESIPMALVLEDDAMFQPGIRNLIQQALSEAPEDWDLLQLTYSCKGYEQISAHLVKFPSDASLPVGAAGYIIRKSGAEKMLEAGLPVCYPADSLIGRSQRWGVKLYGTYPAMITINTSFPTQIQERHGLTGNLKFYLKKAIVSVFSLLSGSPKT